MAAPVGGIDHVVIAVRDLDRTRMCWTRLGFTLTARGRHLQRGTANYCVMFDEDYLELVGVVDRAQDMGGLDVFLAGGDGIRSLAFASRAGDHGASALAAQGLHPGAARDLARQVELADETIVPRFRLISLPPEETPGLDAFICEHLTPELLRRPAWLHHANGAVAVRSVAIVVEATAPLRAAYEKLFGAAAITATDDVLTVHAGAHRLVFATPDDFSALYPEVADVGKRAPPAIMVLTLASRDLDATADHLTQWQVAYEELAEGAVLVPADEADGASLIFTPA
jgi:hypothetical protein